MMFRVEQSPDKPLVLEGRTGERPRKRPEAVVCIASPMSLEALLLPIPHRRVLLEPDPARAIRCVLEGCATSLVMDLECLDSPAFSALVHLRLLRPDLEIILLDGGTERACLQGTPLEGLSLVRTQRDPNTQGKSSVAERAAPSRRRSPSR